MIEVANSGQDAAPPIEHDIEAFHLAVLRASRRFGIALACLSFVRP